MKALTLWQPWAWAVVAGHKRIENRPWPPPRAILGQRVAIHAGKRWDPAGAEAIRRVLGGHGDARDILSSYRWAPDTDPPPVYGAVLGVVTVLDSHTDDFTMSPDDRRWFFGPYGWVLRDIVQLEHPVPCRGFQKLWTLPEDVERQVARQLRRIVDTQ